MSITKPFAGQVKKIGIIAKHQVAKKAKLPGLMAFLAKHKKTVLLDENCW